MLFHVHLFLLLALFSVGLVAAIFDTLVGGGGLITIPAIFMAGLPPYLALGTNKFQSSFGSGSATIRFSLTERHTLKHITLGVLFTAMGALIGVTLLLHITAKNLQAYIPPILLLVLLYAIFSKQTKSDIEYPPRLPYPIFMVISGLTFGFYDAFLGAGVGAFWAAALMFGLGFSIRKATIYAKILNFTSNITALMVFIFAHQVVYLLGLAMAIGQFLGGQIGAYLVLEKGAKIIRPIYITVVSMLLITLSYKTYFVGHF